MTVTLPAVVFLSRDLIELGAPALHTSLLNQLSIRLFWYVTQQASMVSYFSLLQAQQLRGIFYCICNAGNSSFFPLLQSGKHNTLTLFIICSTAWEHFRWDSSKPRLNSSSISMGQQSFATPCLFKDCQSDSFSQHRIFSVILVSAVKALYHVQSIRRNTMLKSSYSGFALPN